MNVSGYYEPCFGKTDIYCILTWNNHVYKDYRWKECRYIIIQ